MAEKKRLRAECGALDRKIEQVPTAQTVALKQTGPDGGDALPTDELERALRAAQEEIQVAVEDLDNLLAGAEIGALYLDIKLRVRKVSPIMSKVTHIMPADLGRPVHHLGLMARCPCLVDDMQQVLDTLRPVQREQVTFEGTATWLVCARPYRTAAYAMEGVLLTLAEMTRSKQLEQALEEITVRLHQQSGHMARQEQLLRCLLEQTAALKLFVDAQKRIEYLNGAARAWFTAPSEDDVFPAELDDLFELVRYETHLRICQAVVLEGVGGRRSVADVIAEPSRDGDGTLLGVLYTISLECGPC